MFGAGSLEQRIARNPHALPILLLILLPVTANVLALTGVFNPDPALLLSGLGNGLGGNLLKGAAGWLDPDVGYITQPLGHLSAQDWLHGIIPWWNPFTGVGMPLAAEMQTSSLFLPFVLLLHFWSGWLWLRLTLQILCGLFTYALLIELRLGRFSALVGAGLFALNGAFILVPHAPIAPLPFLSLLLLGVERARRAAVEGAPLGWSLIVIAVSYSLYAGFPEVAYFDGLLAVVWSMCVLLSLPQDAAVRFARKLLLATMIGLCVALPLIVPFLLYLRAGFVGNHAGFFAQASLPREMTAFPLFPYIFGPFGVVPKGGSGGLIWRFWGQVGGWIGVLPTLLALIAVLNTLGRRVPHALLRWVLLAWAFLWQARSFGFPGTIALVNLIPGVSAANAMRFAIPSTSFAVFVLAACALADWRRGLWLLRRSMTGCVLIIVVAVGMLLSSAGVVLANSQVAMFFAVASVIGSAGLVWLLLAVLAAPPTPARAWLAAGIMLLEAIVLISLPQLAGVRRGRIDLGVVSFLKAHQHLSRLYTLGPLGVNYPAMFRLAAINGTQLPLPLDWAHFITHRLDPYANPIMFTGSEPRGRSGRPDQTAELRRHLGSYKAIGVRYILAPPGINPFRRAISLPISDRFSSWVRLDAGQVVSGTLSPVPAAGVKADAAGVVVGTYAGAASGHLVLRLCAGSRCAQGSADLRGVLDNLPLTIPLRPTLTLPPRAVVHFRITHDVGSPVIIWLGRAIGVHASIGTRQLPGRVPIVSLISPPTGLAPVRVFRNATADVYRLPDPAPYFAISGGPCRLQPRGRQTVRVSCTAPARLIRHELFFAGWGAHVNGVSAPVTRAGAIFQSVPLPTGDSMIHFTYRPPYTRTSTAVALLAVVAWLGAILRGGGKPGR